MGISSEGAAFSLRSLQSPHDLRMIIISDVQATANDLHLKHCTTYNSTRGREGSTDVLCSQAEQKTISRQWILIAGWAIISTTRQIWTPCSVAEWLLSNNSGIWYCECGLPRLDSETAW